MSRNQYIGLEKDDILFVNSEKGYVGMFIFDGKDFQRMITTEESKKESKVIIELDTKSLAGNIEIDGVIIQGGTIDSAKIANLDVNKITG